MQGDAARRIADCLVYERRSELRADSEERRSWISLRVRSDRGSQTRRLVFQNDVQSVDDSGNVPQDGQQDVDEEISTASALEEDTNGWENDGENDLADVTCGERHFCCW